MEEKNGVKIANKNCDICCCNICFQWGYEPRKKEHVKCPYNSKPCVDCDTKEYIKECIFMEKSY